MPANLPPHYFEAEQRFREATTTEDKIEALEEMLAIIPKHKGTDKLKAMLRERISKFKDQALKKKGGPDRKQLMTLKRKGLPRSLLSVLLIRANQSATVRWCKGITFSRMEM